jgi:hypothetical protein
MSQYVEPQYRASERQRSSGGGYTGQTGWVGWIVFGGSMMLLLGSFHAMQGLVALVNDEYFVVGDSGLVVSLDYTAWGWAHLLLGLVVAGAGVGLLAGQTWARIVGVLVAMASAVVNMAFLAAFPIWSALMILLNVLIIWAITVHGRELKQA